ncbi:MAG: heavy metal-responsive transcriptional regulator [Betaproteobacteria bacterium RIFCSPLOWO2_12_FULL_62_58]|nr:MAG: heavy metal-responsive transcriptional regulator [Betaproteobacteria bacterium RIFCSPLOWO2_12_FULL_62_58]
MTIGKIARAAGTGVETIRYYEREGLIDKVARSASGYRHYRWDVIALLRFIRQAKELGFSLGEIKELLSLRVAPGKTCGDVKLRAQRKIADIEGCIATLKRMKAVLAELSMACAGRGPISECPILEVLDGTEDAK